MSESAPKCGNKNYALKLLIAFTIAYSCCFSLGGSIEFLKKINTINYRS